MVDEGVVNFKFDGKEATIKCKHAPGFNQHLLYLSKLVREFDIAFHYGNPFEGTSILDKKTKKILHKAKRTNGLHPLLALMRKEALNAFLTDKAEHSIKFHRSLGHIGATRLS